MKRSQPRAWASWSARIVLIQETAMAFTPRSGSPALKLSQVLASSTQGPRERRYVSTSRAVNFLDNRSWEPLTARKPRSATAPLTAKRFVAILCSFCRLDGFNRLRRNVNGKRAKLSVLQLTLSVFVVTLLPAESRDS